MVQQIIVAGDKSHRVTQTMSRTAMICIYKPHANLHHNNNNSYYTVRMEPPYCTQLRKQQGEM